MTFEVTNVGGIQTATMGRVSLANYIGNTCENWAINHNENVPFIIFSNNGHAISIYNTDPEAKKQMDKADLIHADGQSVVSLSRLFSDKPIEERTATTDMIHDLPQYYDKRLRHFLLGGKKETVSKSAIIMQEKYNNFEVVGEHDGYFSLDDEDRICKLINESKPDVLWVGLGKPKEQLFCIRNKNKLKVPVIISCGGCYNFITGEYPRAPSWMQKIGFEWLFRMLHSPKKLFLRYLLTNPHAIYCVLKHGLFKKKAVHNV